MTRVRITQIDGAIPNLALMRLGAHHRALGHEVHWRHGVPVRRGRAAPRSSAAAQRRLSLRPDARYDYSRQVDEPDGYDIVYASAIFDTSSERVEDFIEQWPDAIVGGSCRAANTEIRVEDIVSSGHENLDYSGYPDFTPSIGYSMRGCRYACKFCVVPRLEGKARPNSVINSIWRGPGHVKRIHDLSNDFFGNPEWRTVAEDVVEGGFEICINQGINVRALAGRPKVPGVLARIRRGEATAADHAAIRDAEKLADEQCAALFRMRPRNAKFTRPTLYTAWDNLGDEGVFFSGVERLLAHGFKPAWITTYMLIGFRQGEDMDEIMHRYHRMDDAGLRVYPMVFGGDDNTPRPENWRQLKDYQAWVVTGARTRTDFAGFRRDHKPKRDSQGQLELL